MVFHFNKKHLEDQTIPMWVVKARGESYYVDHVSCELPWSTKETPSNSHTKGSIKIKKCLLVIDQENCATITQLTPEDEQRLDRKQNPVRFITSRGALLRRLLEQLQIGYDTVKTFGGGCSTTWYVGQIYTEAELLMLQLTISDLRILKPNEEYYRMYDQYADEDYIDENWEDYEDLYEN